MELALALLIVLGVSLVTLLPWITTNFCPVDELAGVIVEDWLDTNLAIGDVATMGVADGVVGRDWVTITNFWAPIPAPGVDGKDDNGLGFKLVKDGMFERNGEDGVTVLCDGCCMTICAGRWKNERETISDMHMTRLTLLLGIACGLIHAISLFISSHHGITLGLYTLLVEDEWQLIFFILFQL